MALSDCCVRGHRVALPFGVVKKDAVCTCGWVGLSKEATPVRPTPVTFTSAGQDLFSVLTVEIRIRSSRPQNHVRIDSLPGKVVICHDGNKHVLASFFGGAGRGTTQNRTWPMLLGLTFWKGRADRWQSWLGWTSRSGLVLPTRNQGSCHLWKGYRRKKGPEMNRDLRVWDTAAECERADSLPWLCRLMPDFTWEHFQVTRLSFRSQWGALRKPGTVFSSMCSPSAQQATTV